MTTSSQFHGSRKKPPGPLNPNAMIFAASSSVKMTLVAIVIQKMPVFLGESRSTGLNAIRAPVLMMMASDMMRLVPGHTMARMSARLSAPSLGEQEGMRVARRKPPENTALTSLDSGG